MNTYRRIEQIGDYSRITEVKESGEWRMRVEWPDGLVTSSHETTVQAMGWRSVGEFLRERPGFALVEVDG